VIECLSTNQMQLFLSLVINVVEFLPNGSIQIADKVWSFSEVKNLWCME